MNTSENIDQLFTALAAAQGEIPTIPKTKRATIPGKDGRAGFSYAYADIADVLEAIRPVLAKHKLSIIQPTVMDGSALLIRTRIGHASGQWIESEYPVCSLGGDHQKMGGAMTYARRYALCSLVGIAADEDTDGAEAEKTPAQTTRRNVQVKREAPRAEPEETVEIATESQERLFKDIMDGLLNAADLDVLNAMVEARTPETGALTTGQRERLRGVIRVRRREFENAPELEAAE